MANGIVLNIDTTKSEFQNQMVQLRQGDGNYQSLAVTVTSNGEPFDLTGWTITFMGTTAGGFKIVDSAVTVTNALQGEFTYTPTKAWGQDQGEFKNAYFKFTKADETASGASFRVNVLDAVDLTSDEAGDYISVVDVMIDDVKTSMDTKLSETKQTLEDTKSQSNTVQTNVNVLGNRVDEYNNKLAAIQVGGRNLFLGTKDFSGDGNWIFSGDLVENVYQGLDAVQTDIAWGGPKYNNSALENQGVIQSVDDIFIMSAWVRNTGTTQIDIYFYDDLVNTTEYRVATLVANSGWIRIKSRPFKFTKTSGLTSQMKFEPVAVSTGGYIQQVGLKLEKGNIVTDWTPAPEDAPSNDAQLVHKTGTETIAGNKTFTGNNTFTQNISGNITGNSGTTTKLQTPRNINGVGFDGTSDINVNAANDSNLVHNSGNETIVGDKTFSGSNTFTGDNNFSGNVTFTKPINGFITRNNILNNDNLNNYNYIGDFTINGPSNISNYPSGGANMYGYLHVEYINSTTAIQTIRTVDLTTYIRSLGGINPVWTAWKKIVPQSL